MGAFFESQVGGKLLRTRKYLLALLLFFDGFTFGGTITCLLIANLINQACCRDNRFEQVVYNLLDHLFPYTELFAAGLVILVGLTVLVEQKVKT